MPISFRCTSCSARLYAPTRTAGTPIECPKCGRRVVVPSQSADAEVARFEARDIERRIGVIGDASEELVRLQDETATGRSGGGGRSGRQALWPFLDGYPFVPVWLVWFQAGCIAAAAVVGFLAGMWWVGR